jgi:cytochrome c biogenesis protein CcmG/thiol:disulfide interchange protein DsbE
LAAAFRKVFASLRSNQYYKAVKAAWKRNLLTGVVLAGIIGLLFLFAAPEYRQGEPSPAGRTARNFTFQLNGRPMQLSDLHGKIVVLNFWATWCPPCVEETPSLNRLQQWLAPRGGTVLGISEDEDAAAYTSFLPQYGVQFPTWRDPSISIAKSFGTTIYPETYVIDQRGIIARKIIGPQEWDSPALRVYFQSQLVPAR